MATQEEIKAQAVLDGAGSFVVSRREGGRCGIQDEVRGRQAGVRCDHCDPWHLPGQAESVWLTHGRPRHKTKRSRSVDRERFACSAFGAGQSQRTPDAASQPALDHDVPDQEVPFHTIDQNTDGLTIRLTDTGTETGQLLGLLQDCQDGCCDCPTDEYEKVSSLSLERHDDDAVTMQLRPKPGERFDESEVRACIQHTIDKTRS